MLRLTLALLAVGIAGSALAQPRAAERTTFEVTYQSVADDCAGQGMTLDRGQVTLRQNGEQVDIDVSGVGTLRGTRGAQGRFKAQGSGALRGDLESRLSVSGRADGQIQMIFIAEFYRGKKPVCTQSWSGQGRRK